MILIVESGATKSDWRVIDTIGKRVADTFILPGINVSAMPMQSVIEILGTGLGRIEGQIKEIYLYVAGVVTKDVCKRISDFILTLHPSASIDIQNDMIAAARAVCGKGEGIVAIMGTGSNAGFYNGSTLCQKTLSGGYILGDYGSASVLGRMFITDYLAKDVPELIADNFDREFKYSYEDIIDNVYYRSAPSRFLGSLAPFILSCYNDSSYVHELVDSNFRLFIDTTLSKYDTTSYPVGIVGGFGYAARDIFTKLCSESGIHISTYIKSPIEVLIKQITEKIHD